ARLCLEVTWAAPGTHRGFELTLDPGSVVIGDPSADQGQHQGCRPDRPRSMPANASLPGPPLTYRAAWARPANQDRRDLEIQLHRHGHALYLTPGDVETARSSDAAPRAQDRKVTPGDRKRWPRAPDPGLDGKAPDRAGIRARSPGVELVRAR